MPIGVGGQALEGAGGIPLARAGSLIGAAAQQTVAQSIPSGVVTDLTLDSLATFIAINNGGVWASAQNTRLTVPPGAANALWIVMGELIWPAAGAGTLRTTFVRRYRAGVPQILSRRQESPAAVNIVQNPVVLDVPQEGDYYVISALQDSGGALLLVLTTEAPWGIAVRPDLRSR